MKIWCPSFLFVLLINRTKHQPFLILSTIQVSSRICNGLERLKRLMLFSQVMESCIAGLVKAPLKKLRTMLMLVFSFIRIPLDYIEGLAICVSWYILLRISHKRFRNCQGLYKIEIILIWPSFPFRNFLELVEFFWFKIFHAGFWSWWRHKATPHLWVFYLQK